jgi:hypothetical protein
VFKFEGGGEVMRRLKVFRVDSPDGEIHLVIKETRTSENSECFVNIDEIKKAMKKEAAKPLVLFREE